MQIQLGGKPTVKFYQLNNSWGYTTKNSKGEKMQVLDFSTFKAAWENFHANKR